MIKALTIFIIHNVVNSIVNALETNTDRPSYIILR